MSFRLVAAAWEADIKLPGCKLVLMGLASYCNDEGECWPRQETLAERTGQSVRTVRDHLAWLEVEGYIRREHRNTTSGRRSDMYLVTSQPAKIAGCATGEKQQSQPAKIAGCSIQESVIKKKRENPAFASPTEEEWTSYCASSWPAWHTSGDAWAYYQSVGWRTKAGPIRDWKAAARTAYGKAKEWHRLGSPQNPAGGLVGC